MNDKRHDLLIRLGHYAPQAGFVLMPIGFSSEFANLIDAPQWLEVAWFSTSILAMVIYVLFVTASTVHDRNLCERDMPDLPDDPQAEVDRNRWRLRLHHCPTVGISLAMTVLGLSIVRSYLPDMPAMSWAWAGVSVAAVAAFFAGVLMVGIVHRRLILWCPWCRRGGGGGDAQPAPTPDPSGLARA